MIISRNYRGDVPPTLCCSTFADYISSTDELDRVPIFTIDGYTYVYVKYNNLYLLGVSKRNSNVALIIIYLYRLVAVFRDYFGELEDESIRDNFVIIYELLDETMDHGYPQALDSKILREYITQEGNRMEVRSKKH